MTDIVILGEVMIELAPLDDNRYALGAAGDTYNTACTLQGLGLDVSYLTALGSGRQAQSIRTHAAAQGLTLAEPAIDPRRRPGLYLISTDSGGERSFEYWRSDSAASALFKQPDTLKALLESVQQVPCLYITGITLALMNAAGRQVFLAFLDSYQGRGGTVFFDPNYRPALWSGAAEAARAIGQLQARADIYLPGFEEEHSLFGFASVAEAAKARLAGTAREVVLKNGPNACTLVAAGAITEVGIEPAREIVDTTGAGDTFNGAYIAARLSNIAPLQAIAFAGRAAAEVLRVKGGLLRSDQLRQLKTFLQSRQQQQ